MVDENIIKDTIRKMKQSGLEDEIIVSTLQDIGLNEEQAKIYIAQVIGTMSAPQPMIPEPAPISKMAMLSHHKKFWLSGLIFTSQITPRPTKPYHLF